MQKEVIGYLKETENLYRLKVGNISVEVIYSENNKKIDECILNILKQKSKLGWFSNLDTLYYIEKGGKKQ